ncbi:hypothetical protein Q31b_46390 [Novipirellula aureliae]|uniref:DUF4375 domain-containing protein n=1 Tax=Novipirellula aureliae TaxID=2527966 RepID=A0A5C6DLY8_9BACT|nr:hypothetical protein [Novipirellula aureliae]TWU37850.1 hypothetical protein Q31b_46390 [Novipirellula aureliae]
MADNFLKSCAASGVTNSQQMFAALGLETFKATFGDGQNAMREHYDQLSPIMQAAILRTSGDPSPEFIDYVWKAHIENPSAQKSQALLLLRIFGISEAKLRNLAETTQDAEPDATGSTNGAPRFEDEFRYAFPAAVSEAVGLKFKPIPPGALERMTAYQEYSVAFLRENAGKPVDEETKQRFSKEANALRHELEQMLQGTIAEPLMIQKQKIEADMRVAVQAKDWERINTLTSQRNDVEARLDEVVKLAQPNPSHVNAVAVGAVNEHPASEKASMSTTTLPTRIEAKLRLAIDDNLRGNRNQVGKWIDYKSLSVRVSQDLRSATVTLEGLQPAETLPKGGRWTGIIKGEFQITYAGGGFWELEGTDGLSGRRLTVDTSDMMAANP